MTKQLNASVDRRIEAARGLTPFRASARGVCPRSKGHRTGTGASPVAPATHCSEHAMGSPAFRSRPLMQHVVLTGRGEKDVLIEEADLVTELKQIKHPFRKGVKAQPGVEF